MPAVPPVSDPVLAQIRRFVADAFCDGRTEGLAADTGLVTSGIVDSAGVVHVIEFLERTFAISIDDADVGLDHFNSLAGLTRLVAAKRAAASGRRAAPV